MISHLHDADVVWIILAFIVGFIVVSLFWG